LTAAGNITYIYDVNGNLASQTVNGQTTQFLYDGARLIAETDANNNITAAYRYFFALQSMERGTTKRYFLFDGQGSTRQLLNESQSVTDTYTYDAFGNVVSASGTSVNPMRYVGNLIYHTDSDSGLALLGLRYYDPTVGRFITADPARAEGNAYLYARANPVNRVDPGGT
jgi:RHS repeat-associated protein